MDPNELLAAGTAVAKVAAGSIPFTAIVKRMLGPAADEVAEMWRDRVRLYRYERQLKCVEKAERMAKEAGFTPQAVPPKILFPLLEGASMEEDETLHDMWAALLANAASPENADRVRPAFLAILKQMSPDEAALLNWMYCNWRDNTSLDPPLPLIEAYHQLGFGNQELMIDDKDFSVCIDALQASRLIKAPPERTGTAFPVFHPLTAPVFLFTEFGLRFVQAVRPPQPAK